VLYFEHWVDVCELMAYSTAR